MSPTGIVIGVYRGGCDVVAGDRVLRLELVGRHAQNEVRLAVGDELTFDEARGIVLEVAERRTQLSRLRPQAGRRQHDLRNRKLIAANMDRLAIVTSVREPGFRSGIVDRFLLAAVSGGLEALLVVNKVDLLQGEELPEEIRAYERVLPLLAVSAAQAPHFALLRKIADRNGLAVVSMGMSADYTIAIQFGATVVRVGTAIFGARPR